MAEMTEARAREILEEAVLQDGSLDRGKDLGYVVWRPGDDTALLDDYFTADQLEAIAWWMRNK